ncbi:hypothetical protein [Streptomyces aureoverticillatus]|uniref:hypothetical protein n=1 Tax=Streptomyces aureoverticillatus TaxID=66871 RepID=UPI0013DD6322|nr:hypothetical protein [Streptomyces aureoverticillatus]QIB49518.1 hypothetical protein G3H79_40830 [Streptomyces aureoverticillatus]
MTLSPVADTTLYARLSREAIPTGAYFRTRTPAGTLPLTPQQQHANYETLATVSRRPQTAPDHDRTPIRCLTIRPPWSDLIAIEDDQVAKRIENRVWSTPWRGTLLIHAGADVDIRALALDTVRETLGDDYELVRRAVVAIADLAGIHADDGECTPWSEEGYSHWELARVQRLTTPVLARGAQRLWKPTPNLLRRIAEANPHLRGRLADTNPGAGA